MNQIRVSKVVVKWLVTLVIASMSLGPNLGIRADEALATQSLGFGPNKLAAPETQMEVGGVTATFGSSNWHVLSATELISGNVSFSHPTDQWRCYAHATFLLRAPSGVGEVFLDGESLSSTAPGPYSVSAILSIFGIAAVAEDGRALLRMEVSRDCYDDDFVSRTERFEQETEVVFTSSKPGGTIGTPRLKQAIKGKSARVSLSWYRPFAIGEFTPDYAVQVSKPNSQTEFGNIMFVQGNIGLNGFFILLPRKKRWIVRVWTIHPVLGAGDSPPETFQFKTK